VVCVYMLTWWFLLEFFLGVLGRWCLGGSETLGGVALVGHFWLSGGLELGLGGSFFRPPGTRFLGLRGGQFRVSVLCV